ncbi:MAG: hypothetical protein QF402_22865 [Candidatus Latescibacteria bacterium]|jgi:hypothetical protein|nr:hypothetical protein [Candidatus Latescibacterota bacterium]
MEHTPSACRQLILAAILIPLSGWTDDLLVPAPGELATAALRIGHLSDVGRYEEAWPSVTVFSAPSPITRGRICTRRVSM